jgi:general stress protein YciG
MSICQEIGRMRRLKQEWRLDMSEKKTVPTKLSVIERARMGGLAVSRNREHMAAIGRKGGESVRNKFGSQHFSKLGSKTKPSRKAQEPTE